MNSVTSPEFRIPVIHSTSPQPCGCQELRFCCSSDHVVDCCGSESTSNFTVTESIAYRPWVRHYWEHIQIFVELIRGSFCLRCGVHRLVHRIWTHLNGFNYNWMDSNYNLHFIFQFSFKMFPDRLHIFELPRFDVGFFFPTNSYIKCTKGIFQKNFMHYNYN